MIMYIIWITVASAIGYLSMLFLFGALTRLTPRIHRPLLRSSLHHLRRPLLLLAPLLAAKVVAQTYSRRMQIEYDAVDHLLALCLIAGIAWLLIAAIRIFRDRVLAQFDLQAADNLSARKIATQLRVLQRIVVVLIIFVAVACALMTFESIRSVGTSLLASVGIAGIILGLAAQKSLTTLMAGLQIAFSQPIRIDDVVVVEGEYGRVEEITLTYVVLQLWDLRRLIVPITNFIEMPFQNWTRVSADLLGTVYFYLDYSIPIEPLRAEVTRLLQQNPAWDGKVNAVQVTDLKEHTMEVRVLISAADAGKLWDLRVALREQLLDYVRRDFPDGLPRFRADIRDFHQSTEQPGVH